MQVGENVCPTRGTQCTESVAEPTMRGFEGNQTPSFGKAIGEKERVLFLGISLGCPFLFVEETNG